MRRLRDFFSSRRGAMVFTVTHMFLGAVTLGIALFRGTASHLAFHHETLLGHANFAASVLASDHARAANAIANNNVISAAIMGPRFAVEADNITMDETAAIACPQHHNAHMQFICHSYQRNKPRARGKLAWARAKQSLVWSSLSKLSADLDRVAGLRAVDTIERTIATVDGNVRMRVEDPTSQKVVWGADATREGCTLAQKDALDSPMPGSAFPLLMPNLLGGLPEALVRELPQVICGASKDGAPVRLSGVPSVARKAAESCTALEEQMRCEAARAGAAEDGMRSFAACGGEPGAAVKIPSQNNDEPTFSSEVTPYAHCTVMTPQAGARLALRGAYAMRAGRGGARLTCTFDVDRCHDEKLASVSKDYLDGLGLTSRTSASASAESVRAPSNADWNHSDDFRVCATAFKPLNQTMVAISDGVHALVSFGTSPSAAAMRDAYVFRSCGKWYFPDGPGAFSAVAHDQQPFVAAWSFALVRGDVSGGAP